MADFPSALWSAFADATFVRRGGMGDVWRATHRESGIVVAVKILRDDLQAIEESRQRFFREIRIYGRIASPVIPRLVCSGEVEGRLWFATEWVDGGTLDGAMVQRPLSWTDLRPIVADIAAALADLHLAGVLHRDVKPSNILLGPHGAKLIDFSVARDTDDAGLTASLQFIGTPGFVAPEGHADLRSDLYSLGRTIARALGEFPPSPDDPTPAVVSAGSLADKEASRILRWLTEIDPKKRPQNANVLVRRLAAESPASWIPAGAAIALLTIVGMMGAGFAVSRDASSIRVSGLIPNSAEQQQFVLNPDLRDDQRFWTVTNQAGCGARGVLSEHVGRLNVRRTNSDRCGGTVQLSQEVTGLDGADLSRVTIEFEFAVFSHSLCGGGRGDGKEAPAYIEVAYIDTAGRPAMFWHGFYAGEVCLGQFSERVPVGARHAYRTDPATWLPAPARITALHIGSNGWDYEADLYRVSITAPR
jgi:hypothetical protein